jgi:hypothetical protein
VIKINAWRPRHAAGMFSPSVRFVAKVYREDGQCIGETGKCATPESARAAGERLAAKLAKTERAPLTDADKQILRDGLAAKFGA